MKTVLLCGEGAHDVGHKEWDSKTGEHVYLEGWMQPLVRKIAPEEIKIQTRLLRELVIFPRPKSLKPIPKGQRDKAAIARVVAALEKCAAIVFMTDADTNVEAERKAKVQEIRDGFDLINNSVKGVPCVPKSSSECWLLSDVDAWKSLGLDSDENFPSKSPEDLWGERNDSKGNHPKHVFARVSDDAGLDDNRDTRNLVCKSSSIDTMKTRCPTSLLEFAEEFKSSFK